MLRTILILSANPRDTPPLRSAEEVREIQDAIRRARHRDEYRIVHRPAVRPEDLLNAIREYQPYIVHFSGHGQDAVGLVLEDDRGASLPVGSEDLASTLGILAKRIQIECVVLNVCYSQAHINRIAEHIAYVIGMRQALDDRAGVSFARAFYEALGDGETLRDAYEQACASVTLAGLSVEAVADLSSKERDVASSVSYHDVGSTQCEDARSFALMTGPGPAQPTRSEQRPRIIWRLAAGLALAGLLVPLAWAFGARALRSRELLIGIDEPFTYSAGTQLVAGLGAMPSLLHYMLIGPLMGLDVECWTVPVLLTLVSVAWWLRRHRARWLLVWLALLVPILGFGAVMHTHAARVHHAVIPESARTVGSSCNPGYTLPQQIQFEVCSWMQNPGDKNLGRRQALAGMSAWFTLTVVATLWLAVAASLAAPTRTRQRRLNSLVAALHGVLLLYVAVQLPRIYASARWGLEYARVAELDPSCTSNAALVDSIATGTCQAVDVTAGAQEDAIVAWGHDCPTPDNAEPGSAYLVRLHHSEHDRCIVSTGAKQTILHDATGAP